MAGMEIAILTVTAVVAVVQSRSVLSVPAVLGNHLMLLCCVSQRGDKLSLSYQINRNRKESKMQSIRSRVIYKMYKLFGSPFDASAPLTQQRASIERQSKFLIMPSEIDVQHISIGDMYAE
jgi:hypothetical protein